MVNENPLGTDLQSFIDLIRTSRAAGVILTNAIVPETVETIRQVVPVVTCCESATTAGVPYVTVDDESASENAAADERRRLLAIPSAMAPPVTGKPRMVKRTGPLGVNTLEMTMKASIAIWGMSIILFPDLACSMHAVMNERSAKAGPSVIMIAPITITARTMMRISVEFLVFFMAEGISSGIPIFSEIYAVMTDAGSEIINRMGRKDIAPRPA